MADWRDNVELLVEESRIKIPYTWTVGETGSYYLCQLRDHGRFWATRCPRCEIVYHPPRRNCPACFEDCEEWVEVGPGGTLRSWTVVRRELPTRPPLPLPFAYGIIVLDEADTGFLHLVHEFEEGELEEGLRLEPVLAGERGGHILDIRYFRPLRGVS